ncbi:GGDEF domain-containing protein [Vibrio makurazakiensis]|uniref:diguanylate cyclase n=1 Tax=Vibrio makurazakiensis TaxID=2910250 RepID=UPI003D14ED2F
MRHLDRLIYLLSFVFFSAWGAPENTEKASYTVATEADDIVTRVLFDSIATEFDIRINYQDFDSFDAILKSVELGKSDFAANVTHTQERAKRFDYSPPTNIEYTFLYSNTEKPLEELETLGVPKNTIYGSLIKALYPEIKLIDYEGHDHAKSLLLTNQVQGIVDAINQLKPMLLAGFSSQLLNNDIAIKPVSIVAPKGKYQTELNQFTEFIHSEKIQRLLRESIAEYQYDLRRDALRGMVKASGIALDQPVTVKLENVYPYAQFDSTGETYGLSAETVFEACELLTLNCQLVSTPHETWESMYGDFIAAEIDIIAPLVVSESRKLIANFTPSHFLSETILVKRVGYKNGVYQNISELISERVGVINDDYFDELLSQLLPNKTLVYYDSQEEMLSGLLNNEIDYLPIGRAGLSHIFREQGLLQITEDYSIDAIVQSEIAIGIVKSERGALLTPLFERALQIIDTERINSQYVQLPDWRETLEAEQMFAKRTQVLLILVIIFSLVAAMFLHHQSRTDSLTRLRNRRSLQSKYKKNIKSWHTVVSLDINHFKQINDTYGHEVGDLVLQRYADKISKVWNGRSYRVGGDEFILIGDVRGQVLSRVIEELNHLMFTSSRDKIYLKVTVSVGVSTNRTAGKNLRDILRTTDKAMYQSKERSGGTCTFVNEVGDNISASVDDEPIKCSKIA